MGERGRIRQLNGHSVQLNRLRMDVIEILPCQCWVLSSHDSFAEPGVWSRFLLGHLGHLSSIHDVRENEKTKTLYRGRKPPNPVPNVPFTTLSGECGAFFSVLCFKRKRRKREQCGIERTIATFSAPNSPGGYSDRMVLNPPLRQKALCRSGI